MIAYYLHSRRPDRTDRARAVLTAAGVGGVVVSPDPAPFGWVGPWDRLVDASPEALTAWTSSSRPAAVVIDGPGAHSREVSTTGCTTVFIAQPGAGADQLIGSVDLVLAPWSAEAPHPDWPREWEARTCYLGAVGAAAAGAVGRRPSRPAARGPWRCLSIAPTASGPGPRDRREILGETPLWRWWFSSERDLLEDGPVWDILTGSDVLVCAPTPTNLAAAAAARLPAVLVVSPHPSAEQRFLAEAAIRTAPVLVVDGPVAPPRWRSLLEQARSLDRHRWSAWSPEPGLQTLGRALRGLVGEERSQDSASVPVPI